MGTTIDHGSDVYSIRARLVNSSGVGYDANAPVLAAGEAVIGQVVSPDAYITSTPTFSVGGAGATGDYMGTTTAPQSFAGVARLAGGEAIIKSLTIVDKLATAAVALELWLYSATFTAPTDNAAWSISDADALNCVAVLEIGTANWYASALNKTFSAEYSKVVKCSAQALFYAIVARGTTPAWATGDLQLSLGVLQ